MHLPRRHPPASARTALLADSAVPKERKNPVRSMLPVWLGHEGFGRPGAGERLVDSVRLEEGGVRSVDDFPLVFFLGQLGHLLRQLRSKRENLCVSWWQPVPGGNAC